MPTTHIVVKPINCSDSDTTSGSSDEGIEARFEIAKNEVLSGKTAEYKIKKFLNNGSFGQVACCVNLATKEKVAIKILRKDRGEIGKKEVAMLEEIRKLDKDHFVKFTEHFKHKEHDCLVFEMLDMHVQEFLRKTKKPLGLHLIREITKQLLAALDDLKSIGLAHADLKPDNIMIKNHRSQPLEVKMIDFGLAIKVPQPSPRKIQPIGYRAPEVILGLPFNEAVDMWGLGCIVAYMYLGRHLYPINGEYEVMKAILQMQGQPDDHLLNAGTKTKQFFYKHRDSHRRAWKMKTQDEYLCTTGILTRCYRRAWKSLDDIVRVQPEKTAAECEEEQAFISFLKEMLQVDPAKRITPSKALSHSFITKKHLDHSPEQSSVASETKDNPAASAGSLPKAGLNEATAAGTNEKPPSDGVHLVEVKTRRKFLKRFRRAVSRIFKLFTCCKSDVKDE